MQTKLKVGLIGYGKAGKAVANVLSCDSQLTLSWIAKRNSSAERQTHSDTDVTIVGLDSMSYAELFDRHPVDAVFDFSSRSSIHEYGEELANREIALISAISAYTDQDLAYARSLGQRTRVVCSPNMTLGINFLMVAAQLLRKIAPFADVEILEQHFREKPEFSGTALKIAQQLEVEDERITSMRLGGIVGHHEVIFGFPHQTLRLTHDSIRREAFGTGAVFALTQLMQRKNGFYTFDDLLLKLMKTELKLQALQSECA